MRKDQAMKTPDAMEKGEAEKVGTNKAEAASMRAGSSRAGLPDCAVADDLTGQNGCSFANAGPGTSGSTSNGVRGTKNFGVTSGSTHGSGHDTLEGAPQAFLVEPMDHPDLFCHPDGRYFPTPHFNLMARINILHLKAEVAKMHHNVEINKQWPTETSGLLDLRQLEDTLHRYSQFAPSDVALLALTFGCAATAVRDYGYMQGLERYVGSYTNEWYKGKSHRTSNLPNIEELVKTNQITLKYPQNTQLTNFTSDPLRRCLVHTLKSIRRLYVLQTMIEGDRWLCSIADVIARFVVAFTGGLSLVVPMLIMRIHEDMTKSLITASVAVILFSAVISLVLHASNAETLGITAAYTAVLVVLVGSTN